MPLYNFFLDSSRWIRIIFIINLKIKILTVPVLLLIKNLIKIKSLHYVGILRIFITLGCLFNIRLLHKLPTRFSQPFMTAIILLQSANVGLLAGLKPIHGIPWLKRNQDMLRSSISLPDTPTRRQNRANTATFIQGILATNILHDQLVDHMWEFHLAKT